MPMSCMGAAAFLRLVSRGEGKFLLRMESVVGSQQFDGDVQKLNPQAIKWVPGTDKYKIFGVPYTVSDDAPRGLARVRMRRKDPKR